MEKGRKTENPSSSIKENKSKILEKYLRESRRRQTGHNVYNSGSEEKEQLKQLLYKKI